MATSETTVIKKEVVVASAGGKDSSAQVVSGAVDTQLLEEYRREIVRFTEGAKTLPYATRATCPKCL